MTTNIDSAEPIHSDFPASTALPLLYRTYSRRNSDGSKESPKQVKDRAIKGLNTFGLLTKEEFKLVKKYVYQNQVFPSGRWMWIGGTEWVEKPKNYIGAYNCASLAVTNWEAFRFNFRALLMGCGVGTVVELSKIKQLPEIRYPIKINITKELGSRWIEDKVSENSYFYAEQLGQDNLTIDYVVGDSKEGWVSIATHLLEFASIKQISSTFKKVDYKSIILNLDLSQIRPAGTPLKGFGGLANPDLLVPGLQAIANILNKAVGRQLNSLEVILISNWAGAIAVSGNIRRSAKIQEGSPEDELFVTSKDNLWVQDAEGNWKIDPERDVLRLSNHTVVYHNKPSLETIVEAVRKQYYSGEGAIKYAPEAVARANVDLLDTEDKKRSFLALYCDNRDLAKDYLVFLSNEKGIEMSKKELDHRIDRYFFNPCLSSDTMVLTSEGHFPIKDLVGKAVNIWDGNEWVKIDNFRVTGHNQELFEVELQNGQTIKSTEYHRFILSNGTDKQTYELAVGDILLSHDINISGEVQEKAAYLKGFAIGDGTSNNSNPILYVYEPKWECLDRLQASLLELPIIDFSDSFIRREDVTFSEDINSRSSRKRMTGLVIRNDGELGKYFKEYKSGLPLTKVLNWTEDSKLDFLAGLLDADGTSSDTKNGFMYQISSVSKQLLLDVQLLLISLGVKSKISVNKPKGKKDFNDGYGEYDTKTLYRLTISQASSILLSQKIKFTRLTSFKDKKVVNRHINKSNIVKAIRPIGKAEEVYCCTVPTNHRFSLSNGIVIGQCGEIVGNTYKCNLSDVHANMLNPYDLNQQEEAFKAATLVALPLLAHEFDVEEFRYSREIDPIIGVCITGLFDFFVNLFGEDWLVWWKLGRDKNYKNANYYLNTEKEYLSRWKNIVKETVTEFCTRNNMKVPNRFTSIAPSGSKSLLTGASPGWHPPKDTRYIRRITYSKDSPIAQACADYGYKVIPSQSCKDEFGNLLDDINDPRVNEVLVEIPVQVPWADLADKVDFKPKDISALAQLDFCMQVQQHYVGHNTSATIELREDEIEPLGRAIYELIQNDEGYISVALLAKFESLETFPRLPFEPISHEKYLAELEGVQQRRISDDFLSLVNKYSTGESSASEQGPAGCDSDKCLLPERK
jgi:ribonucleotide reductase class II